ncbi:hypothetical protein BDN72DRAFT_863164 [Pluteus cervinus]|uniref:Uncharacterized protein n=1 Tax=Pluteus cervinus TaxID=181527 RepID=A0ACD3A8Z7_9AGAR|nr:hypothetical protein BDN72DRAFT_863164 [Pluteus cervinus]
MYRGFRRHLPPITNRLAFIRGRSLSPDDAPILITNRMAFTTRYKTDEPGDKLLGTQGQRMRYKTDEPGDKLLGTQEDRAVVAGPSNRDDVMRPVNDGEESSSEEGSEDGCNGLSDSELQPCDRPDGRVSKPNDNGYSLGVVLGWSPERYRIVQNHLRQIAKKELDCRVLLKGQNEEARAAFLEKALKRFPFLAKYPGGWPAEDFASIYLKNCRLRIQKELKGKVDKRKGLARKKAKGKGKGRA